MKALIYTAPNTLEFAEAAEPIIRDGDALIRVDTVLVSAGLICMLFLVMMIVALPPLFWDMRLRALPLMGNV